MKQRITVPQAWSIDQLADGNTLVIGTVSQQFFTIDENTLTVTQHLLPSFPGVYYVLYCPTAIAMKNGTVFLLAQEQGIAGSGFDGGQHLIKWNPTTDSFTEVAPLDGNPGWAIPHLVRSADHKWAAFSANQFYLYSSSTDSFTSTPLSTVNPPDNTYGVRGYALNADGSKIAVASAVQVTFLDGTFNTLATTPIPSAFQDSGTTLMFTADGNRLIVQYNMPDALEVLDANSYSALGYQSGYGDPTDQYSTLMAMDSAGRAFVNSAGGYIAIDTTQALAPNPSPANSVGILLGPTCPLPSPANSALNVSTTYSTMNVSFFKGYSFYFGGVSASSSADGQQVTTPVSPKAGAVDVECVDTNGNSAIIPFGFSYGIQTVGVSANLLPPIGNPLINVYGFGFEPASSGLPSVSVGGQSAATVQSLSFSYGSLQGTQLKVPQLPPNITADITVTSSFGSSTLKSAASYIPSAQILPATGILQLLFDTHRSLLYALKASEIDVLNSTSLNWQTPITLPASGGVANYDHLAISPDGSKLIAVANAGYAAVIDPDHPSPTSLVLSPNPGFPWGRVVVTKYNKAVITSMAPVEIDLSTLATKTITTTLGGLIAAPADGSVIYGINSQISSGDTYATDPGTYQSSVVHFGAQFWADLAVAPDGTQFAAIDGAPDAAGSLVGFFDNGVHLLNFNEGTLVSPRDDSLVFGSLYGPKGKVLMVALGDSIEFWDTVKGTLRARLMTPEELHVMVYPVGVAAPQIALDATGQTVYAVSASGLTVLTLPQPIDDLSAASWNNSLQVAGQQRAPVLRSLRSLRPKPGHFK